MDFFRRTRTNWGIILALIFIEILVVGWILFFTKSSVGEIEKTFLARYSQIGKFEEDIEVETLNWKTYRNEEYGFEIKYPKGATITKVLSGLKAENWVTDVQHLILIDLPFAQQGTRLTSKNFRGIIRDINSKICSNHIRWLSEVGPDYYTVANINNIEFKKISEPIAGTASSGYHIEYFTTKENKCFFLDFKLEWPRHSSLPSVNIEIESEIFNQMLSTFRFLE